ncbi:hypothetical protein [Deinococcus hopiensis]|uniref:Uncharacterized protein n=1 Tax=Deinococcus hopiensis KR-140 TaxID=695939 RepID=A0A1W1VE03_9DEIO|nr:hypothetical protein [Deinococcus hopiensis]SMB91174.1 hypothetical protein SAMN00790413_01021 [Deinococcus hopiensis KR-140]
MSPQLRTWPTHLRAHLHDRYILARLLIAGHTPGFGLIFLLQKDDLIHNPHRQELRPHGLVAASRLGWGPY